MFLPNTTLFYLMVEVYLHLLPKVQLHVSALDKAIFRVYRNPSKVVIQDLIWAVYSGDLISHSPTSPLYTAHIKSCVTAFKGFIYNLKMAIVKSRNK